MTDRDRVKADLIADIFREAQKIMNLGGGGIMFAPSQHEWDAQAEKWYRDAEQLPKEK